MHTKRMTAVAAAGAVGLLAMLPTVAPAHTGATEGPTYPPPGGVTLTWDGDIGRAGGLNFHYADLDLSGLDELWWGAMAGSVGLAFDGAIDAEGETLSFDAGASDLSAGVIRYAGQAELPGHGAFATRFTARASSAGDPLAAAEVAGTGIEDAVGAVFTIPGDYSSHLIFEVFSGGTWKPAKDFFDAAPTDPGLEEQLRSEFFGGFWFVRSNVAPVASFEASPDDAHALQDVTFTSTSSDSDGTIVLTEWDLDGDGEFDATGDSVTHAYDEAGSYEVAIRVTDDDEAVSTSTQTVEIAACEGPVTGEARTLGGQVDDAVGPSPVSADATVHAAACGPLYGSGL